MGINDGEASVEIIYFNESSRLQAQICDFFTINFGELSVQQQEILQAFISWLLKSLVFDTKDTRWKYKNLGTDERGSFTFSMSQDRETGFSSFAHLLYGGDPTIPWTHFDFDRYEFGYREFTEKLGISFSLPPEREIVDKAVQKVRDIISKGGDLSQIEQIAQATRPFMFSRSSCMDLLAELGLDYGADNEGVVSIPLTHTLV